MLALYMKHFSKFFFVYTILPLLLLSVGASYFRFIIQHDYLVVFEGSCEPESESCFVGTYTYEDCLSTVEEDCEVTYFYKMVEKPVVTYNYQIEQCGTDPFLDPLECEPVSTCHKSEQNCSIVYCSDIDNTCTTGLEIDI